jgi:hypothetical protein
MKGRKREERKEGKKKRKTKKRSQKRKQERKEKGRRRPQKKTPKLASYSHHPTRLLLPSPLPPVNPSPPAIVKTLP